jgi:hypothetical protein
MEQKKTYRAFQFGNVVAWNSELQGQLSDSGHLNVEVDTPVFKGTTDVCADLLIGALNPCPMLTFLYQMQHLPDATPKIGFAGLGKVCHARSSTVTENTALLGLLCSLGYCGNPSMIWR